MIKGTNEAQSSLTRRNPKRHIPLVSLLLWHKMVAVHPFVWTLGLWLWSVRQWDEILTFGDFLKILYQATSKRFPDIFHIRWINKKSPACLPPCLPARPPACLPASVMPLDLRNSTMAKATGLIFSRCFSPRGAFSHTAVHAMHSSSTYHGPPLCPIHLCSPQKVSIACDGFHLLRKWYTKKFGIFS